MTKNFAKLCRHKTTEKECFENTEQGKRNKQRKFTQAYHI